MKAESVSPVGDIVQLAHVNVEVPDQHLAYAFYVVGLGLTRDPYLQTSLRNMWINAGRSQFHIPTGAPTLLRGHVGIVMPGREALLKRLDQMNQPLAGTRFGFAARNGYVEAISPWGNRYRVYEPAPDFAPMWLGISYVEFEVPAGTAERIVAFYAHMLSAPGEVIEDGDGRAAKICVGNAQHLRFSEVPGEPPPYDGHHIQLYVTNRAEPLRRLGARNLLVDPTTEHEFRFDNIIDLDSGTVLFTVNHEMRTLTHPLYARKLINRNPMQGMVDYAMGYDDQWTSPGGGSRA